MAIRNTLGPASNYLDYNTASGAHTEVGAKAPLPVQFGGPLPSVTPDVSSSPQSMQAFGDGTNDVFYLRFTVNAGDDTTAGSRIKNGYPDTTLASPANTYVVSSDSAITRIDVCAFGDTQSSTAAGAICTESTTEAVIRSMMQTFDFDSADSVKTAILTFSERYSGGTSGVNPATAHYVRLLVEGKSHA